jgi:hypothetical protein
MGVFGRVAVFMAIMISMGVRCRLPGMLLCFVAFVVGMGVIVFCPDGAGQGCQQGKGQWGLLETYFGFHKKFPIFL